MPRFMLIVKANRDSEAGKLPSAELLREMGKFNEELIKAGMMLAGEGLHPSSKGARVFFSGKNRTVAKGPFTETKDLVAGFWVIKAKSLEEAIEWVKRVPNPTGDEGQIEIRQVQSEEDFGPELLAAAPEVFEAERKVREREDAAARERQKGARKKR